MLRKSFVLTSLAALALTGCTREGDIDSSGGIAITRSACPGIAIPVYTGDVTLFSTAEARTADAIDVVATLTNLRSSCVEQGEDIVASASFDVVATRTNTSGARQLVLPYFATVVQGGRVVVSKRISTIVLNFADGARRAEAKGSATGYVNHAAATLPPQVQERLTRKRKAGDVDAALDPLADPDVRAAVQKASFELLVGFQLTDEQLKYNATR
ncbi:MAG: hypothetical protein ACKOAN_01570 [Chakrabartia sp.]|jgi:hypothetical protein